MVYVISKLGHSLMPTMRHGKVRRILWEKELVITSLVRTVERKFIEVPQI